MVNKSKVKLDANASLVDNVNTADVPPVEGIKIIEICKKNEILYSSKSRVLILKCNFWFEK